MFSPEYIKNKTNFNKLTLKLNNASAFDEYPYFDTVIADISNKIKQKALKGEEEYCYGTSANIRNKQLLLDRIKIIENLLKDAGYKTHIKCNDEKTSKVMFFVSWD